MANEVTAIIIGKWNVGYQTALRCPQTGGSDMARLVDEMTVPIKCPKCGHETEQSLARLKDDPILICPSCGDTFKIESSGTMGKVADELDEIDRLIDKIGKD
jgi:hypothetical protein